MKEHYQKSIITEIEEISIFSKTKNLQIQHNSDFPINDCRILLSKSTDKNCIDFYIELKSEIHPNQLRFNKLGFNNNFGIVSDNKSYIIPAKSVNKIVGKEHAPSNKITGEVSTIFSESFPIESNSFYRSIFIIEQNNLTSIFLGSQYSCDETNYALGLITIDIEGLVYHIFRHNRNELNYLVIESLDKVSLSTFKNISGFALKSIALLTGNWYQKEQYIFAYKSTGFTKPNSIYYESLNTSVITNHDIINPVEFRSFITNSGSNSLPKLTPILFPQEILSNVIANLKSKPELERTISLLVEGMDIGSPILKCSIFYVALETITGLIYKENKSFFEPIKSSDNLQNMREKFQVLINNERDRFDEIEYEVLVKKIKYLNTPFNKDKFILAFEFYKIELPEKLKTLLGNRNKFLHGKTPFKENILKTKLKALNLDADRIHMLVSILVLKYSNYEGHIKNYAGYKLSTERYYDESNIKNDDDIFYQI